MKNNLEKISAIEITKVIKKQIEKFNVSSDTRCEGYIISLKDGIALVYGLEDVMYGELLNFGNDIYGLALNLEQDFVGAIILGDYTLLQENQKVFCTGELLKVPVGKNLLGRVVNALGVPIDNKGSITADDMLPIECIAPSVIDRQSVSQAIQTGIKAIDTMIPIGRGQRELIIGDRQTGKTAIAIDTIINQRNTDVKCVYVAIGQKASSVANVVRTLEKHGAMHNTIIVAATAANIASMQFVSAYAGCAMGEYFRDRGEDALIIFDDLTKHAWAYRQISLLLRRPPGREAYPGDVFYIHSRLLERASRVNSDYINRITNGKITNKTGSLTALPIIETQGGDVSAFVPTNVISITDGQIYLETDLFNIGIRPAISSGLSVSRVGGAAQSKLIKKLSGGVRIALAQYRELEAFAKFASDLDEATRKQLERGKRYVEVMKQKQYNPLSVANIAISLLAVEKNFIDDVEVSEVINFMEQLIAFADSKEQKFIDSVNKNPDYTEDNINKFISIIKQFKDSI